MNLQTYLESGILELYVLNLLDELEKAEVQAMILKYPELKQEKEAIELALQVYAFRNAIEPSVGLKEKIEQALMVQVVNMTQKELISIDENSDYKNWLLFVAEQFPAALAAENFCELIGEYKGLKQVLVVSSFDIEEETHEDAYESFLILQGKCRCNVEDNIFYLEAGGYTEIPLQAKHLVEIVEGPVMAIVQYRAVI